MKEPIRVHLDNSHKNSFESFVDATTIFGVLLVLVVLIFHGRIIKALDEVKQDHIALCQKYLGQASNKSDSLQVLLRIDACSEYVSTIIKSDSVGHTTMSRGVLPTKH